MDRQEILWTELFSYEAEIFSFVKDAVGDADIARDLFQDIYLSALKNLEQLDPTRSLKNWLYTTARNRVINYFREHKRRDFTEFDEKLARIRSAEDIDKENISASLNALPERQKKALLLHEVDGFSYEEISAHLNLSISAVTGLISRAKENFRRHYLLYFLPSWLTESARQIELSDLFRFINPFNPPLDILNLIDRKRRRYFTSIAAEWDKIRENYISDSDLEGVIKNIGLQSGQMAADLGCGTGFITIPMALVGLRLVALDADQSMLAKLVTTMNELDLTNISPVCCDLRGIPLKRNIFDHIFLVLVLHHLPDPFSVIEICTSLLRNNGQLIIIDFQRHRRRELADQMHDLWLGFNPHMLAKRLKKSGLVLKHHGTFERNKKIPSFFQIWMKK